MPGLNEQILKDVPGSDPSKMSITVTYRSIPKLTAEIVVIATKMGEKSKALACLESIFDDELRAETTNRVYEIAQRLWMDELVAELFKRGHVKDKRDIKRAGMPSLPSRMQVLPQTAAHALVTHAERMQQEETVRALSAAKHIPEVVVDMGEEEELSSDEEPDILAHEVEGEDEQQKDEEFNYVDQGEDVRGEDLSRTRIGRKEREEKMRPPYWLADEESLKLVQEVKNLVDSQMKTMDVIHTLATKHGHTLTVDFVEDIRDRMQLETLTSGTAHGISCIYFDHIRIHQSDFSSHIIYFLPRCLPSLPANILPCPPLARFGAGPPGENQIFSPHEHVHQDDLRSLEGFFKNMPKTPCRTDRPVLGGMLVQPRRACRNVDGIVHTCMCILVYVWKC